MCRGARIKTIINGVTVADYDGAGRPSDEAHRRHNVGMKGHIGLQTHPGKQLPVRFKDIEVRESKLAIRPRLASVVLQQPVQELEHGLRRFVVG